MELKNCIRYKGKVYCWDVDNREMVEIVIKPKPIRECPDVVIEKFLMLFNKNDNDNDLQLTAEEIDKLLEFINKEDVRA